MTDSARPNIIPSRDITLKQEERDVCAMPECKNDEALFRLCQMHHDWMGDYLIAQIARDAGLIKPHPPKDQFSEFMKARSANG